jgi:hypothetical protein
VANRPFYYLDNDLKVQSRTLGFDWFAGFSIQQKQKSIASLHRSIVDAGFDTVLEISSKSPDSLGVRLSAFNLTLQIPQTDIVCSVESAFQGSKVFKHGGPFNDLFRQDSRTARSVIKAKFLGPLTGFDFGHGLFPLKPVTAFYDWLYVNAILQNDSLHQALLTYRAFTDIEFNPHKSFNCQAFSAALFVSIYQHKRAGCSISFDELCQSYASTRLIAPEILVQNELF